MKVKARKWGNSVGIVIPKEIADSKGIEPGDEVLVEMAKLPKADEIFGSLKGWKRSAQQIKDEARRSW